MRRGVECLARMHGWDGARVGVGMGEMGLELKPSVRWDGNRSCKGQEATEAKLKLGFELELELELGLLGA